MSTGLRRSPQTGRQSLFFRDLATPVSARTGKFMGPGQAAAVTALWRENFGTPDPPPPPILTLEERGELTPEPGVRGYSVSPEIRLHRQTSNSTSISPLEPKYDSGASYQPVDRSWTERSPARLSWWSPGKGVSPLKGTGDSQGQGISSQANEGVQPGALIMLPPPREVAKPDFPRNIVHADGLNEETWVTIYGFSPADTNLVLREFEKCGTIMRHVPGPRNANWIHILYQNGFDAQRALSKNGSQINSVLIIGVKPLDPNQRQHLDEKLQTVNQEFMVLPPKSSAGNLALTPLRTSRPYHLHSSNGSNQRAVGAVASPAKSAVSRIMDLMFGV